MQAIKPISSKEIDNRPWTLQDIGQNSIHSIMNDPTTTSKLLQLPVQTLAIPKTQLKAYKFKDFGQYIKDIDSIYQQYMIMIQTDTDDSFLFDRFQQEYKDMHKLKSVQVDNLFFQADFDLRDPKVFDTLTQHKNVTSANLSIGSDSNYNQVLQEQLSHQLDTVEVQLVREISQRSQEFFSALTNIQSLHESTMECLVYLRKIRSTLKVVDDVHSQTGLQVVQKQRLVDNLQKLVLTIDKIKEVKKTQPNIQILLNEGDYISAIELIDNALSGQTQLAQIKSLQNLSGQLQEMSKVIGNLMENDFVTVLASDQETSFVQYEKWSKDMLFSVASGVGVSELVEREHVIRDKLKPLIQGLIKVDRFSAALQMYRDRLMKSIKNATKQFFPPALPDERLGVASDDGRTTDNVLAKRFRVLTFDKFYELLISVYSVLMMHLRRINVVIVIMNQIVKQCEEESVQNKSKFSQALTDTADILYAAADLAHVRCGKLLTLRSEQNAQLNIKDFFKLFDLSWRFVQSGEEMAQRTCIGLRGLLMSQTKSFITYFHMERMKQIAMLVDNELWVPAEVPVEFQVLLNNITGDSLKAVKRSVAKDDDDPTPAKANMQTYMSVGVQDYNVVSCVPMFIKMIDEYLACVVHVPTIAADVLNRILELSKFFNNRICGVIVGGAAVQSSVLKSITAKHLALAGQSLGFMVAVLPFIKIKVQDQLPIKQQTLANEFDTVIHDYQANQKLVFSRVVMIMEERINAHAEGIRQVQWDAPYTQEDPSPYIKALVKETQKLHKILAKYLFTDSMRSIFRDVFAAYNKKLENELARLDIYSPQAKSRMLVDVQFYINQLTALENVDSPGNQLEVVVNNVRIRDESERPPKPVEKPKTLAVPASAALDSTQQKKSGFGFSTSFSGFNKFMSSQPPVDNTKK